jgi:hypothetical protein
VCFQPREEEEEEEKKGASLFHQKKKNRLKKNLSQKSRETLFEPTKDKEIILSLWKQTTKQIISSLLIHALKKKNTVLKRAYKHTRFYTYT